jgi:hypothetical protein
MSTSAEVLASASTVRRTCSIASERPSIIDSMVLREASRLLSARTLSTRRRFSAARCTTSTMRSDGAGFSMKS